MIKISSLLTTSVYGHHIRSNRQTMDPGVAPQYRLLHALLAAVLLLPLAVAGKPSLSDDQNRFLAAETALKKNQNTHYQRLKARLTDYPLYPYLEFQELKRNRPG